MLKTTGKLLAVALMRMSKSALDDLRSQMKMEVMMTATKITTHVTYSRKWLYQKERTS